MRGIVTPEKVTVETKIAMQWLGGVFSDSKIRVDLGITSCVIWGRA